jgi:hypothetical protein
MSSLFCPHTDNCTIYQNWTEATGRIEKGIIYALCDRSHSCIPLTDEKNGRVRATSRLSREIFEYPNGDSHRDVECSYIRLLNLAAGER